ncbi:MAG: hypothetical protein AB7P34_20450 [Vicinamibacterales bacterium]
MHIPHKIVSLCLLPAFFAASPAFAQQTRAVDASVLSRALAQSAGVESAQRDLVRRVLDRSDARELAGRLGLDVAQASSALATLSAADLATLAQHAGAVEAASLAGGASTIVISLTTLLLLLIIVILLAN